MSIQRMMVPGEPEPFSHYCHVVRADKHVYVSGAVGIGADGQIPADTFSQFDHVCSRSASMTQATIKAL